ncbi:MAG: hypothetical protein HYW50_04605 [Candidatus Diapherotrites archaeon]|nr:hypothetical protein [Candidatus Diapherotrites archaeon]
MKTDGYYFSLEATIALFLILMITLALTTNTSTKTKDVLVLQKMHDLLLVWAKERDFSEQTLKQDFEFVFPAKGGLIEIDGKTVEIRKSTAKGRKISEEINYLGKELEYKKIVLTIFD